MVAARTCTYSPHRPLTERAEAFVYNTGCHIIVASMVNGLFLYWLEAEDLSPGVFVGGGAAIAQNLTHSLVHFETHYRKDLKETCRFSFGGELLIGVILTYYFSKGLLKAFDCQVGRGDIVRLGGISIISIAVFNRIKKS